MKPKDPAPHESATAHDDLATYMQALQRDGRLIVAHVGPSREPARSQEEPPVGEEEPSAS